MCLGLGSLCLALSFLARGRRPRIMWLAASFAFLALHVIVTWNAYEYESPVEGHVA